MTTPHSVDFMPPRSAWLFGHVDGPVARRRQVMALVASALLLAAATAGWWFGRPQPAPAPVATVLPAVRPAVSVAPSLSAADRARINRVVRRLNTPWGSIFEALENQAGARAALLSLETDADRGVVRVSTEGPSLDELLQHAEQVQATAPFVRTRLLRIESPEGAAATAVAIPPGLTRLSFDLVIE